ncbi:hypothetical protein LG329_04685 [Virgibacillus necropolis]|uniref:hypothetical protein n=1 Tax=Virgibacillus necropolis TaxID=163877 RepID=UPI00384F772B
MERALNQTEEKRLNNYIQKREDPEGKGFIQEKYVSNTGMIYFDLILPSQERVQGFLIQ